MKSKLYNLLSPNLRKILRTHFFWAQHKLHKTQYKNIAEPKDGWPIILGISIPKSGTHLLTQILTGFSKFSPFAPRIPFVFNSRDFKTGEILPVGHAVRYLSSLLPMDVSVAHLVYYPETAKLILSNNFFGYFIYRDPRDIIISYCHYFGDIDTNSYIHPYLQPLRMEDRIKATIKGFAELKYGIDIGKYISLFTGWLEHPTILAIKYEDLINHQHDTLIKIVGHFSDRITTLSLSRDERVKILQDNINPQRSPTFRSGKTGEWYEHFTEEHKKLFKDVTGDLLIRLGYEKNNNW